MMLRDSSKQIKFRRALKLNLGSIGKGYALDRVAERFRNYWGITSALLQAGGSSVLAIGCPPNDLNGWRVNIKHPEKTGSYLGSVYLAHQALGTSAATYQHFELAGKRYGHVIDPRSGRPASGTLSASVIAPSAAEADAYSTAIFVGGVELGKKLLQYKLNYRSLILEESGEYHGVNLVPTRDTFFPNDDSHDFSTPMELE